MPLTGMLIAILAIYVVMHFIRCFHELIIYAEYKTSHRDDWFYGSDGITREDTLYEFAASRHKQFEFDCADGYNHSHHAAAQKRAADFLSILKNILIISFKKQQFF